MILRSISKMRTTNRDAGEVSQGPDTEIEIINEHTSIRKIETVESANHITRAKLTMKPITENLRASISLVITRQKFHQMISRTTSEKDLQITVQVETTGVRCHQVEDSKFLVVQLTRKAS